MRWKSSKSWSVETYARRSCKGKGHISISSPRLVMHRCCSDTLPCDLWETSDRLQNRHFWQARSRQAGGGRSKRVLLFTERRNRLKILSKVKRFPVLSAGARQEVKDAAPFLPADPPLRLAGPQFLRQNVLVFIKIKISFGSVCWCILLGRHFCGQRAR